MHRYLRHAILENLDTVRRLPVGRFWGVRVFVTPLTWLFPFIFFALRLGLNALGPPQDLASRLNDAALFTAAVGLGTLVHALGHNARGPPPDPATRLSDAALVTVAIGLG